MRINVNPTHSASDQIEVKFWWIPQVPGKAFEKIVPSVSTGRLLEQAFADYDLFQLEHNIKPDFSNTGGIVVRHPKLTDGEWWDLPSSADELDDMIEEGRKLGIDMGPLKS
jgi:hypothetical protein